MGFHGVQLLGISLVIAALALGQTTNTTPTGVPTQGLAYEPNGLVAVAGVFITIFGIFADPYIERLLQPKK